MSNETEKLILEGLSLIMEMLAEIKLKLDTKQVEPPITRPASAESIVKKDSVKQ